MAKIEPFRALIYNQEKVKGLASVVCPPYDIISPSQQQYYHNISPYNFIHMLLGEDIPGEDKYKRARNIFKDWQKNKILVQDDFPAVYFYSQQYRLKGEKRARLGFIARLYLEDKNSAIYGHEHTHLGAKEDRLKLLKNVKANLSPIFVVFSDKKRVIQNIYQQHIQNKEPFIDITDEEKINHKLWRLDSTPALDKLKTDMQNENIFIADGHHRYEVACAYRDQMRKKMGAAFSEAGFNYTLAYFTNTGSSGLAILPIHRLVKLNSRLDIESFELCARDYFDMEEIKDKARLLFLMEKAGGSEYVLGMYYHKKYYLLRLKNIKTLGRLISDKPPEFKPLDVSILNCVVLKKILGMDLENKDNILFSHDASELIQKAESGDSYAVFFLNPAKIQQIVSVALAAQKMPPKSTYFYPKVLSGLVINKFDG